MIMKQPHIRYNSININKINKLPAAKSCRTPVQGRRTTCHLPVDNSIHNFIHSFSMAIPPGFSTGSYSPRQYAALTRVTP